MADLESILSASVDEIQGIANTLGNLASSLSDTGNELQRINSGAWQGIVGDAFRSKIQQQPWRYSQAGNAFSGAGSALASYSNSLYEAKSYANRAIQLEEEAQSATFNWEQHGKAAGVAVDPGIALREQAASLNRQAVGIVDGAAGGLSYALQVAEDGAPKAPSVFHDIIHGAEDVGRAIDHAARFVARNVASFASQCEKDAIAFADNPDWENASHLLGDMGTVVGVVGAIVAVAAFILVQFVPGADVAVDAVAAAAVLGDAGVVLSAAQTATEGAALGTHEKGSSLNELTTDGINTVASIGLSKAGSELDDSGNAAYKAGDKNLAQHFRIGSVLLNGGTSPLDPIWPGNIIDNWNPPLGPFGGVVHVIQLDPLAIPGPSGGLLATPGALNIGATL